MDFWFIRGLAFYPIFVIIWTYLTFSISYIISVARGDVDPGFPYISDTGARKPESCVFGQMLNITAAVSLVCLYIRYKQVDSFLYKLPDEKLMKVKRMNVVAMVFAVIICLGMSLVANFQETSVLGVHIVGALMTFVGGAIYESIQTYISYKMNPEINGKLVCHIRLIISILSSIFILVSIIVTAFVKDPVKFHWKPSDEGYAAHLASTITEWLLAASFLSFFYTFIRDFQVIKIDVEPTLLRDNLHHDDDDELRATELRPEERTPLIA